MSLDQVEPRPKRDRRVVFDHSAEHIEFDFSFEPRAEIDQSVRKDLNAKSEPEPEPDTKTERRVEFDHGTETDHDIGTFHGETPTSDTHYRTKQQPDTIFWSDANVEAQWAYQPLPNGAIRILHLLPGKGNEDVKCELVAVSLDSNPYYEAISYAWGENYNLVKLSLNGKACLRAHNLVECLKCLRLEDEIRILWVDALCINQADLDEKSVQVNLMAQIYRSASRTLIWLGDNAPFGGFSIPNGEILDEDDRKQLRLRNPYLSDSFRLLEHLASGEHFKFDLDSVTDVWGLQLICDFGWWSRTWVVQETLLSVHPYLVVGKVMLPWDKAFRAASNFLTHSNTCCNHRQAPELETQHVDFIFASMSFVVHVILSFHHVPPIAKNELLANLWMFRNRMATLDDDKVYGILGLLRSPDYFIEPDYEASYTGLCRIVAIGEIRSSGNLHVLKGIRTEPIHEATETWYTDWSDMNYWLEDRARILTELYKELYTASGSYTARFNTIPGPFSDIGHLCVAGKIVDRIEHVSQILTFVLEDRVEDSDRRLYGELQILKAQRDDESYIAGGSAFMAFCRTLLADCIIPYIEVQDLFHKTRSSEDDAFTPSIRRATSADIWHVLLWYFGGSAGEMLERVMYPDTHTDNLSESQVKLVLETAHKLGWNEVIQNINASVARATGGRRMFITAQGYVGLGPEHTRIGDQFAILLGGSTPFVLREAGSTAAEQILWNVLGDCYVHGCMDGELVRDERTEDWPMLVLK